MTPDQHPVLSILRAINTAWTTGHPEDARPYLHPDLVAVNPGFQGSVTGADAFIESYREFAQQATMQRYEESDFVVEEWGATAVAHYRFDIEYEYEGVRYKENGRDLFVFNRSEDGAWLAVWRTLVEVKRE